MSEPYISVVTEEAITCGTLLGPLPLQSGSPDSLAVLTWRCVDDLTTSKQVLKVTLRDQANNRGAHKPPAWLSHILPARNAEEQTLEVMVKSGQLYFRALRDVHDGEELRAWFGQDLADILRLPMIPPKGLDGEKHFECILCHEQFDNPFPVVAHLMYRCRRKDNQVTTMTPPVRKKNGGRVKNFDIATLTDMNEEDSTENRVSPENLSVTDISGCQTADFSPDIDVGHSPSPRKKRKLEDDSPPRRSRASSEDLKSPKNIDSKPEQHSAFKVASMSSGLLGHSAEIIVTEGNGSSAFKKVDKSNAGQFGMFPGGSIGPRDLMMQHSVSNAYSPFSYSLPPTVVSTSSCLPSPVSSALTSPTNAHLSSAFAPKLSSMMSCGGNVHEQMKMAEDLKMMRKLPGMDSGYPDLMMTFNGGPRMPFGGGPKPQPIDTFGPKAGFPTPLLPFLPPSLAALTFPTQNWCAKCNASFRMTSDLVYHMRSHHKRESDPQKLKREEKLRCHICNETFRERHHLTRHMTSHQ